MLETIREYALDRLAASGESSEIARRHLAWFRDLAGQAEPHFVELDQVRWADRFDLERDNVRLALWNALESRDAEAGLTLGAPLWRFWLMRGYAREGRQWLEQLLALEPSAPPSVRARALLSLGGLTYWLSDVDATDRAYGAAVGLYREIGDRSGEAEALYDLAYVPVMRAQLEESRDRFEAVMALALQLGRTDIVARSKVALSFHRSAFGDSAAGLPLLEEAVTFFRGSGNVVDLSWTVATIGNAQRMLGHYPDALAAYQESLQLSRAVHNEAGAGAVLRQIGALEASVGHHASAVRLLSASAAVRERTGSSAPNALSQLGDLEGTARVSRRGDIPVDCRGGAGNEPG
jgi:tetratricopeptide (TPR) repeat protein